MQRMPTKHECAGDIFTIPLFLPAFQEWTALEDFIDYKRYKFPQNDMYAFGRLIETQGGGLDLVEIFSYVGKIPENPEAIIRSGRLFEPVMMGRVYQRGRWRFLFDDPHYDKWIDSDYGNVSFLLHDELWKGGEKIKITWQQREKLEQSGIHPMVIYGSVQLEREIRSLLTLQGLELNYEQIVEERRNDFPKPRDLDQKLKETISPFGWLAEPRRYSLSLESGLLNDDCFAKNNMLGNGYDWEKVACAFLETHMPAFQNAFTFDCEADTFSMQSPTKKKLKEFALAFHQFVLDKSAFEALLSSL